MTNSKTCEIVKSTIRPGLLVFVLSLLIVVCVLIFLLFNQTTSMVKIESTSQIQLGNYNKVKKLPSDRMFELQNFNNKTVNSQSGIPETIPSQIIKAKNLHKNTYYISGNVQNETGESLDDIRLSLYELDEKSVVSKTRAHFHKADELGNFHLELSNPYGYKIVAKSTNWTYRKSTAIVPAVTSTINFVLRKSLNAEVYGIVTDIRGIPISGVVVTNGSGEFRTVSDDNGQYTLETRIPTTHLPAVSYFRTGYEEQRTTFNHDEFNDQSQVEKNIVLADSSSSTTLASWVRSTHGQGLSNLQVKIHSLPNNLLYTAYTNEYGYVEFEGIRANTTYKFEVEGKKPYSGYSDYSLHVTHGMEPVVATLERIQYVSISGRLIDEAGNLKSNFTMNMESKRNPKDKAVFTTNNYGYFELSDVPVGDIVFRTIRPPHFRITGITIDPSSHHYLQIPLNSGWHTMTGQVLDHLGLPIHKARVVLKGVLQRHGLTSSSMRTVSTQSNGLFEFTQIGKGLHDLTIYVDGYDPVEVQYDVGKHGEQIQVVM